MLAAIDIGGTKTRLAIAKTPLDIIDDFTIPTPRNQSKALEEMLTILTKLAGKNKILSLGISSPGPIDKTTGTIMKPRNIPWNNLTIVRPIKNKLGCLVSLNHDATLAGIAEAKLGAGKNYSLVLYVTISTGIGTAIILDGKPISTKHNSEGGLQIIDSSPRPGLQYQKSASGNAIKQKYHKIAADITSKNDWDNIGDRLSVGLFNLITIVQPDVVILGGGVSVHYDHFIAPLLHHLARFQALYPLPPIKQAKFVETAPLIGALQMAQSELTLPNARS